MQRFIETPAGRRAHKFALRIRALTRGWPQEDADLASDLWGAALCIPGKMAGASGARSRSVFTYFMSDAIRAADDVERFLTAARNVKRISADDHRALSVELKSIRHLLEQRMEKRLG